MMTTNLKELKLAVRPELIEIKTKMNLHECPVCGRNAVIRDHVRYDGRIDGIGFVGCKNDKCMSRRFWYSGKNSTTKNEAIGMWNIYCVRCDNREWIDLSIDRG